MANYPPYSPLLVFFTLMMTLVAPALVVIFQRDKPGIARLPFLVCFFVVLVALVILKVVGEDKTMAIPAPVVVVFALLTFLILLAATVRRLTSVGWSPWLAYVAMVPFISLAFFLVLFFVPHKKDSVGINDISIGPEKHGPVSGFSANNHTRKKEDKYSKYKTPDRARWLGESGIMLSEEYTDGQSEDLEKSINVNINETLIANEVTKEQDLKLLRVSRLYVGAKSMISDLENMGSKRGIIDLPLNDEARKSLTDMLDNTMRMTTDMLDKTMHTTIAQDYDRLAATSRNSWTEEFQILFEYDPVVKDCHDSLEELDPQLSSQFRQEVVDDRKKSTDIRDLLMVQHDNKVNPYNSSELNQALSEAKKLGPSVGDEFVQIIEIMGEDVDADLIIGRLREKYAEFKNYQ